jgi:predicted transcriptional regulator
MPVLRSRTASDQSILTLQSEGLQQQVSHTLSLHFPAQSHARIMQDSLMDALATSASRQKEIARAIAGELKEQDVILDELEDEVDDAEEGLLAANKRVSSVLKDSRRRDMTVPSHLLLLTLHPLLPITRPPPPPPPPYRYAPSAA